MLYRRTPESHFLKTLSERYFYTTCYDYYCSQAWEEGDLVAKEKDRGPDEESPLASVGHTVSDGADVVHQVVGCDGLTVEEYSIKWVTEEQL